MIVSISQPAYLPWLGYFNRVAKSDLSIVLDNVMIERSSKTRFTNRNKIRTNAGAVWLTIPVKTAGLGQPLICDAELDEGQKWAEKHYRTIVQNYKKSPYYKMHEAWLEQFYNQHWSHLAPVLNESTSYLLESLGIDTPRVFSSKMQVEGKKSDLILNLCKHVGATTYLSGPFGREYLELNAFSDAGISVEFDDYEHPVYPQQHPGFEPYMSIIDLLFNCGGDSLKILKGG